MKILFRVMSVFCFALWLVLAVLAGVLIFNGIGGFGIPVLAWGLGIAGIGSLAFAGFLRLLDASLT